MYQLRRAPSTMVPLTLALALVSVPADAFRMIQTGATGRVTSGSAVACNDSGGFVHWTTAGIPWRLNTALQGSGKASAIQSALASWTNVSGANHFLSYAGTTTAGWATDGTNTVLWANGNGCTGTCLALTALVVQSGQVLVESDITFNNTKTWTINGNDTDTETVAAHELGHSLGIHHTEVGTTPRPTMYATYFGSGGRSLESDDVAALQCSQSHYPVGTSVALEFTSIAAEDGNIIESTETSNVGGAVDSTTTGGGGLKVGDTALDRQRKSILSFATGSIPDGATIDAAVLLLWRGEAAGTSPFTTHGPCRVDVKKGTFGSAALAASDFQASATSVGVANLTDPDDTGPYGFFSTAVFNAGGRNAINKTGRTQLRIYCSTDDDDDSVSDYTGFYAGDHGTDSNRPKLLVGYH